METHFEVVHHATRDETAIMLSFPVAAAHRFFLPRNALFWPLLKGDIS